MRHSSWLLYCACICAPRTLHTRVHLVYLKVNIGFKTIDLVIATCRFTALAESSDELDCPRFGEYFGELISSMALPSAVDFTKIISIINALRDEKDKKSAFAQCIKFAAERVDKKEVAISVNKALAAGLPWGSDSAFKDPDFLKSQKIDFITTEAPAPAPSSTTSNPVRQWRETTPQSSFSDPSLVESFDKCLQKMDVTELVSICSQNAKSKDADKFVKKIFEHGKSK